MSPMMNASHWLAETVDLTSFAMVCWYETWHVFSDLGYPQFRSPHTPPSNPLLIVTKALKKCMALKGKASIQK